MKKIITTVTFTLILTAPLAANAGSWFGGGF
jgi:hypothetical protein